MVIAEIGDIILVPINLTIQIDGFDNTLQTAGKEGLVIETLFDSVNPETGEDLLNYFLRFGENFDLVNVSGTVVATINEFWFRETDLTQSDTEEPDLPLSLSEINNKINTNKNKLRNDLVQGQSILSQIPVNDPIYRGISETIVNIMSDNNAAFAGLRFNPNDPSSVSNITTQIEGSTLVANDGTSFLSFLNVLKAQQQAVSSKTSSLKAEEDQTIQNDTRAAESEAEATNTFIESLSERTGADTLHLTAESYTPVDWSTLEPTPPSETDILPPEPSSSEKAARLFPLLDPSVVVQSGLI